VNIRERRKPIILFFTHTIKFSIFIKNFEMMSIKLFSGNRAIIFLSVIFIISCKSPVPTHLRVIAELNIGETQDVVLVNGDMVKLSLLDIHVVRDSLRNAIRAVNVRISVDGKEVTLNSGNYNLPVVVGKVQIDCPVINEYNSNSRRDVWGLEADARFRLWPKDSPFIQPGTFAYPVKQAWFASKTQSGNEPSGLGWAEDIGNKVIYYHEGHDIGGAEGKDEILSATNGLVISSKGEVLEGYDDFPGDIRPDVVYVLADQGWYIRYSHFDSIDPEIKPGIRIQIGQRIGLMGKQGGSGGWVHLHLGLHQKNPNTSKWEVEDAYVYVWEAYVRQHKTPLTAVARQRHLLYTGQEATLDGTRSRSLSDEIISYEWTFTDGTTAEGPIQKRRFDKPGEYSEILKVTDSKGNVDYDFTSFQVYDREYPEKQVPTIHATYHPSLDIKPGDPVTFLVRTYGSNVGDEVWDFGDGTEKVTVNSGVVQRKSQNEGKYAETIHSFSKPGDYIVKVERTNEFGFTARTHLHVRVDKASLLSSKGK
jgi:murein DD-endopeptidase MepM/ murein hydrolase activator NlpD